MGCDRPGIAGGQAVSMLGFWMPVFCLPFGVATALEAA